jgi:glutamyl-tRNA(Gln) amidotransferase subunit E
MTHSEDINPILTEDDIQSIFRKLKANKNDAFVVFDAQLDDVQTALETIEERCLMAFDGVPEETRKSLSDGTTIFERVLPGADRMYPDTDSAPIPLSTDYIEKLREGIPEDVIDRFHKMQDWGIAEDTYTFILSKNLYPILVRINNETNYSPKQIGNFLGHNLKFIEGHFTKNSDFRYEQILDLFKYIENKKLDIKIAHNMLVELYKHSKMDFDSILESIKYKAKSKKDILAQIPFLKEKFKTEGKKQTPEIEHKWIMGQLNKMALGNINMSELSEIIKTNS